MKNIQTTLNIILAAAIAVLFFLQFKGSSGSASSKGASKGTDSTGTNALKVAYVDLDSIQVKYTYYKEKTDEFARKNESAERDVNNALQNLPLSKSPMEKNSCEVFNFIGKKYPKIARPPL
jgi:outer membrane protein